MTEYLLINNFVFSEPNNNNFSLVIPYSKGV